MIWASFIPELLPLTGEKPYVELRGNCFSGGLKLAYEIIPGPEGTHWGWQIYKEKTSIDLAATSRLRLEVHKRTKPELTARIDTAMGKTLKTYEAEIRSGGNPLGMPLRVEPEPVPSLTATEKTGSLRSVTYLEASIGYLRRQTDRTPPIKSRVDEVEKTVATLKADIIADPPTPRSTARHASLAERRNARRNGRQRS